MRKLIGIMRELRKSAPLNILKNTYTSICESILIYCIGVWGCAAKTFLIEFERAQRAVLKTMLRKPFRFPTDQLYKDAQVLSVRQLYIRKACLSTHKSVLRSEEYPNILRKRVYKITVNSVRTHFARKFSHYAFPTIYNTVVKQCDIKTCSIKEAKLKLSKWLSELSYNDTELLIPF